VWQLETLLNLIDTLNGEQLEWLTRKTLPGWQSNAEFYLETHDRVNELLKWLETIHG